METTTVSANIQSLAAIGGLTTTAVPGCINAIHNVLGVSHTFILELSFFLRKCTPDTLCGHGEGECRLKRIRTRVVCLKFELSF